MSTTASAALPASTTPAATAAMTQLATQLDAYYTTKMNDYLTKTLYQLLGVDPAAVAVVIATGNDMIGIAAQSKQGSNASTSGQKLDCVASPKQWAADRCNEITQQWAPLDAAVMAAKAAATAAKVTAA